MAQYKAWETKYIIASEPDTVRTSINFYAKPITKQKALDDVIQGFIIKNGHDATFTGIKILSIYPFLY